MKYGGHALVSDQNVVTVVYHSKPDYSEDIGAKGTEDTPSALSV